MVQLGPGRVNNPDLVTRTSQRTAGGFVLKDETPSHVEAVPLEEGEKDQDNEGFFGRLKHMFSDKKETDETGAQATK